MKYKGKKVKTKRQNEVVEPLNQSLFNYSVVGDALEIQAHELHSWLFIFNYSVVLGGEVFNLG